jgi:quercetin dioxygenase-like cupin family protein
MRHLTRLSFAAVLIVLGCTDAPVTEDIPDAVTADPDHYSVEFENDVVRVVRVEYGAGETSAMHRHPALCSVALGESSWRMNDSDGAVTETSGSFGDVGCEEASVHNPENAGTSPNEVVLIELSEGAAAGSATMEESGAVAADPDHYAVEFENESVRVLRIRYAAGDTGVLHSHPANCIVWLSGPATEGEPQSPGQVQCSDAQTHTPSGAPDAVVELLAVEFKGRETLQR